MAATSDNGIGLLHTPYPEQAARRPGNQVMENGDGGDDSSGL